MDEPQRHRGGAVFLSNATVDGAFCLRACLTNHRTTPAPLAVAGFPPQSRLHAPA